MKKLHAIIFDLDGTLIDSLRDLADTVNQVLQRRGLPVHPLAAYRRFIGEGLQMLIRRALPQGACNEQLVADCVADFRVEYEHGWQRTTRPFAQVAELLEALSRRRLALAVLSNKPDHFTVQYVEAFFGRGTFRLVMGERPDRPRKPDPAGAWEIARQLELPPAQIAFIGDSATDMETAVRAGMCPVGALWGYRDREELAAAGAMRLVESPLDLLDVLG